jgi:hypothetical protein
MADFFDRPTPGESLLAEPKSRPYERPAEMSKLSDVIDLYVSRITKDEVIDNVIQMLDLGVPVELLVESITLSFVMQGTHSMDNKMLISPMLHEYIRMLGKKAGVKVVDGLNPDEEPVEDRQHLAAKVRREVESLEGTEEDDEGVDLMRQTYTMLDEKDDSEMDDLENTEMPVMENMGVPVAEEIEDPMPSPKEIPIVEETPLPVEEEEPLPNKVPAPQQLPNPEMGLMSRR